MTVSPTAIVAREVSGGRVRVDGHPRAVPPLVAVVRRLRDAVAGGGGRRGVVVGAVADVLFDPPRRDAFEVVYREMLHR